MFSRRPSGQDLLFKKPNGSPHFRYHPFWNNTCYSRTPLCTEQQVAHSAHHITAASSAGRNLHEDVYTSQMALPRIIGPVEVVHIAGKGRGLLVTEPVAAGDLIMVTPPLALALDAYNAWLSRAPTLARRLRNEEGFHKTGWWNVLTNGNTSSEGAVPILTSQGSAEQDSNATSTCQATLSTTATFYGLPEPWFAASSAGSAQSFSGGGAPLDEAAHMQLVQKNAFMITEDAAAAAMRGRPDSTRCGLWPEAALLNHSCAPNTNHIMLKGSMVIRATRPLAKGDEVTLDYGGILTTLSERRERLQKAFGFQCRCERCRVEESFGPELSAAISNLQGLTKALSAGGAAGTRSALQQLQVMTGRKKKPQAELVQMRRAQLLPDIEEEWSDLKVRWRELLDVVSSAGLDSAGQGYVYASLYPTLVLMRRYEQQVLGEDKPGPALGALLNAHAAVDRGCSGHVKVAARQWVLVQARSAEAVAAGGSTVQAAADDLQARQDVEQAHILRYGRLSDDLMARLVSFHARAESAIQ